MSIRTQCPRCKQPLAVPQKMASSYVNCPRCSGRFWVNETETEGPANTTAAPGMQVPVAGNGASTSALPEVMRAAAIPTAPQVAPVPSPSRWSGGLPTAPASVPAPPVAIPTPVQVGAGSAQTAGITTTPPAAPPVVAPTRKVARLVTSDAASSSLKLAADGQLPNLHLDQADSPDKAEAKQRGVRPAVLFGLLPLCVAACLFMLLAESGPPRSEAGKAKAEARRYIREHFFGGGSLDKGELAPYQIYLREAQQAHSRGDRKAERQYYQKVLALLHAENAARERGLTGSHGRDKELETRVVLLLSEN
jgi:DNA-directed RNA polymerase subunit RPC12/RpoP